MFNFKNKLNYYKDGMFFTLIYRTVNRKMINRFASLLLIIYTLITSYSCYAEDVIYVAQDLSAEPYHTDLLNEIFNHSNRKDLNAQFYNAQIPHHRAFLFMSERDVTYIDKNSPSKQQEIDIVFGYATQEREDKYTAIPIPILKGLNGWRVSLVHKDNIDLFKDVKDLEQFKTFKPGSHNTWTDSIILTNNGITPVTGSSFIGLYHMLDKKRFDYFPRGLLEVYKETQRHIPETKTQVAIEPHMLLIYPTAVYMYVAKDNVELAKLLQEGIDEIIANGLFDDIFYRYYGDIIKKIKADHRHVFILSNSTLPKSVPLQRSELWVH